MINERFLTLYGVVSIALMVLLLLLVWLRVIPSEYNIAAFMVVLLLFIGRIVLRIVVARRNATDDDTDRPA